MAESTTVSTSSRAPEGLWKPAFLTVLAETGNATKAAEAAKIDASTAYHAAKRDPEFKADWERAKLIAADTLRAEAWRRAVEGGRQYKFHPKTGAPLLHPVTGEPYYEIAYSDGLLTLLLKAYAPEEFKDRSAMDVNATVKDEPKYDLSKLGVEDLLAWRTLQRKLQVQQEGEADAA